MTLLAEASTSSLKTIMERSHFVCLKGTQTVLTTREESKFRAHTFDANNCDIGSPR